MIEAKDIIGVWTLVSIHRENLDTGEIIESWGAHPTGFIHYTAGGRMIGILSRDDRPRLSNEFAASRDERARAFNAVEAYAGTYTIKPDCIIHHVEAARVPNWIGGDQVRFPTLKGDLLTLETPETSSYPGIARGKLRLTWRKIE